MVNSAEGRTKIFIRLMPAQDPAFESLIPWSYGRLKHLAMILIQAVAVDHLDVTDRGRSRCCYPSINVGEFTTRLSHHVFTLVYFFFGLSFF